MKRLVILLAIILSGCEGGWFSRNVQGDICPQVQILRDQSYLSQYVNYKETFQISINGYEGYCYFDEKLGRHRAVIYPIFKIKRLTPSDETDVRFSYYTETVKGPPEYLGKKTYFANAHIKENELETYYKASAAKVFIPSQMGYDYDINLGLWLSPEEANYNHKTFDINYRYIKE